MKRKLVRTEYRVAFCGGLIENYKRLRDAAVRSKQIDGTTLYRVSIYEEATRIGRNGKGVVTEIEADGGCQDGPARSPIFPSHLWIG